MPCRREVHFRFLPRHRSTTPQLKELTPGDYLRISLADNGVGMDEATLAKATEPFFTTKEPGRGTGLGLSMVYGMAAQSGGALHLSSVRIAERRSISSCHLRRFNNSKEKSPRRQSGRSRRSSTRLNILVVDDDFFGANRHGGDAGRFRSIAVYRSGVWTGGATDTRSIVGGRPLCSLISRCRG